MKQKQIRKKSNATQTNPKKRTVPHKPKTRTNVKKKKEPNNPEHLIPKHKNDKPKYINGTRTREPKQEQTREQEERPCSFVAGVVFFAWLLLFLFHL